MTDAALRPRSRLARGVPAPRLLSARNLIVVAVVAVIAYLGLVRSGFLFWQTFVKSGTLTIANFRDAYISVGLGTIR